MPQTIFDFIIGLLSFVFAAHLELIQKFHIQNGRDFNMQRQAAGP